MISQQNEKLLATLPTSTTGADGTATLTIDTNGFEHASISVMRASNASTVFATVLKVEESDDNSSYTNVTSLVGGGVGGFTIPAVSNTSATSVVKMDVVCRSRKRYLKVSATPSTAVNVAIAASLSNGENAIGSAADAGVIGWVKG